MAAEKAQMELAKADFRPMFTVVAEALAEVDYRR
jgi:hypothetical protein